MGGEMICGLANCVVKARTGGNHVYDPARCREEASRTEYLRCAVLFNGHEYSTWDTPEEAYAWLARMVDRIARRPVQSAADDVRVLPIGRFTGDSLGFPVTDGRHVY